MSIVFVSWDRHLLNVDGFASWSRHLLNVDRVRELGPTFTMSMAFASWDRHLLNVDGVRELGPTFTCVHELGGTFTKCRLCLRAGSDIY